MHIHSFISCSFPSAIRITSSITTTTSTSSSSHGSLLHLALLPSFFLSPPHLSPLSALIHPTHPAQHGEGASHHAVGHSAGVHYGGSPAGQAKHAGALRQLQPHPHLPAAHLHHCLANLFPRHVRAQRDVTCSSSFSPENKKNLHLGLNFDTAEQPRKSPPHHYGSDQ